ncbi:MAG: nucleotidyltransferase domain-containing protein [Bacteroidia bacterium]|nr:nucleotidyltransferase domain-containing protein [Bacteroidia bacterium]
MGKYLENIIKRRAENNFLLKKLFRNEAYRLAQILEKEKFVFKRIYLFGSVVSDKPVTAWTDVDLAIEGLEAGMFYKVYAYLLKSSKYPIDLKPLEELEIIQQKKIKKKGELIYERL